jgi:pumilio RNA-binding family
MYGCRVIQQLLNVIDERYIPEITEELEPHFAKCIEDQNGNHVIQKIIERLQPGEENGIFDVVLDRIHDFCIHQYGCRVIQKLFTQSNEEQKNKLLDGIYQNIIDLCQDQYGNYVIQYVLEKQKGINVEQIYEDLQGKIFELSIHKFGSNVIEKALSYGSPEQREIIINEILSKDDLVHDSLLSMVKDKYGNYVVQKMIEFSDSNTKESIIKRIISSQSLKKRDGFCKLKYIYININTYICI